MSTPRGMNLPGITWSAEPTDGVKKNIGVASVSRNGMKGVPWHWSNHRYKVVNVRWSGDQTSRPGFNGATADRDLLSESEDESPYPSGSGQRPHFSDVTANWNCRRQCPPRPEFDDVTANSNNHRHTKVKVQCQQRPEFDDVTANSNNHRHTKVMVQCPQRPEFDDVTANSNNHRHTRVMVQCPQRPEFDDVTANSNNHRHTTVMVQCPQRPEFGDVTANSNNHRHTKVKVQSSADQTPHPVFNDAHVDCNNHRCRVAKVKWSRGHRPIHANITWAPKVDTIRRANIIWSNRNSVSVGKKIQISWLPTQVTNPKRQMHITWAPTSATCKRVNVTWKEQEPKASLKPLITWAQEPIPCCRKVANINWIVESKCQTPEVDCLKMGSGFAET